MKFQRFLTLVFLIAAPYLQAQNPGDTIVVNTFNYTQTAGSGIRDTMIEFPNLPGVTFEKIIMKYNMRCKGGLVSPPVSGQTNIGCGEWDYSCNTYLHDSTRIDSVGYTTPSHTITGFSGTVFNYTNSQPYDYYQYTQQQVVLNSITSENQYPVLVGTAPSYDALAASNISGKSQYLFTAAELTTAGMSAGNIDGFLVNALNGGGVNFLRINIKGTSAIILDSTNIETTGFTEVYFSDYNFVTGSNRVQFYTPFVWNGSDNVIIEFSFTNSVPGSNVQLESTLSSPDLALTSNNGFYQNVSGDGHITIPAAGLAAISNQLTVSFWAFGDANLLPANTTIIEGLGANGERDLNVHLPWGNSQVYWDCGGDGAYDRINKPASTNEFEGQWNHWSFVKNATTGVMQIYLNGVLWHSGTGNTKPIDIVAMVVGKSNALTNNYKGSIDELQIWNKALTGGEILSWMNIPLNATHPQYSNLVAYYKFDEGYGISYNDNSLNGAVAAGNGSTVWKSTRGIKLNRFFTSTGYRPSLIPFNGTYNTTVTPVQVMDSVALVPNTVDEFVIVPHPGAVMDDEVQSISSIQVWEAVPQNIYDASTGLVIGTAPVTTDGTIMPTTLDYQRRWPMKFEIMSFVTPYGINLNMGPDGKTWTFDMTDYTPILKGSKRMTMERGGQRQEDMDIQFLFIVGTPERDVLDIREIWRTESRGYASILNDTYFAPRNAPLMANGNKFKVLTSITGHGQEGEFIPRIHTFNVNGGTSEFSWQVWKECAENPVYPQGGTWIYDRSGWCPGMATNVQESDITSHVTAGTSVMLDYGLSNASGTSNYIVSNKLVTYGPVNNVIDGSITAIKQPTDQIEYARFNSICREPIVVLKNTGSTAITTAKIKYWVNDETNAQTFDWIGNLAENNSIDVPMPAPFTLWSSLSQVSNRFHAKVIQVNGAADNYTLNDHHQTNFIIPEVMPSSIVVHFRTNNAGSECSFDLRDDQDQIIFSRSGMASNTLYKDTIVLPIGCISYNVYDTDDDGLSFFANNDGSGYTRFYQLGGPIIKNFGADYGDGFKFNFTSNYPLSYEEINGIEKLSVYPNPTNDELNIELTQMGGEIELVLFDQLGKIVRKETQKPTNGILNDKWTISELPAGVYILSVSDGSSFNKVKIIKQ